MYWPTLIVDNFFTDPHRVVNLSKTFKYTKDVNSAWPGTRSSPLHEVNKDFFLWSTRKIMALLYPMHITTDHKDSGVAWEAAQYFQRIPYKTYGEEGWIHGDHRFEFTSIIYLSNHPNSGTCLYEGKNFNIEVEYEEERQRFFKELTDLKRMEKYRDKANSKFTKKVELFSNFNRLVLFDGHNWHASRNAGSSKEDRLTLITFFKDISHKDIRYPIPSMRRIQDMSSIDWLSEEKYNMLKEKIMAKKKPVALFRR